MNLGEATVAQPKDSNPSHFD